MQQILFIREVIINFLKRYEAIILFLLKFFFGLFIFSVINNIGFQASLFNAITQPPFNITYILLMGLLFAILPNAIGFLLISANLLIQTSSSIGMTIYLALFLVCISVFYIRFAAKESILILVMIFAYYIKIPYIVPIVAGMYLSLSSVIPIVFAIIIWNFIPKFKILLEATSNTKTAIMEMPTFLSDLYEDLFMNVSTDSSWIFTAFTFVIIVLVVHIISQITINYNREIAIISGALVGLTGGLVGIFVLNTNTSIISFIVSLLIATLIAFVIKFFDVVLDYSKSERVSFEDSDNFYYVKVIPKINSDKKVNYKKDLYEDYEEEIQEVEENRDVYEGYEEEELEDYKNYYQRKRIYDEDEDEL